jgi:hypothetical protein
MHASWSNLAVGYLVIGLLIAGLPVIFFIITFLPGLMRTTGEHIGQGLQPDPGHVKPEQDRSSHSTNTVPVGHAFVEHSAITFANTP